MGTTNPSVFFLTDPSGHTQRYASGRDWLGLSALGAQSGDGVRGESALLLIRNNNGNRTVIVTIPQEPDLEPSPRPSSSLHLVFTTSLGWGCCSTRHTHPIIDEETKALQGCDWVRS